MLGPICDHGITFKALMEAREGLAGDIAEFGVFNGGSTRQLAAFGRPVWAFDTYEGIPTEDYYEPWDKDNPPGKFKPDATVETLFEGCPNIIPVKGRFKKTLHIISNDVKFVLVYLDCDYYKSYRQVLRWLPRHLVPGAALVCDDWGILEGANLAIKEFLYKWELTIDKAKVIEWPEAPSK